jgi:peptidoglycan/LPS O-acetylase OafA/YrhL
LKAKFYGQDSLGNWSRIYTLLVYPGIIILTINNPFLRALLSLKIFSLLGDISYSIYLLHFPIQLIIFSANEIFKLHFDYYSKTFFLFNSTVIILISYLSYTYFERPILLYLRTWLKKRKTGPGEGLLNAG